MKLIFSAFLFFAALTSIARADENDLSILSEFGNYRLTDVGEAKLNELYESLTPSLTENAAGYCFGRAHIWSYQLQKQANVQSGKIFLFYSWYADPKLPYAYRDNEGWWFHVVPYVIADGKEYVMEKFQDINRPMLLADWLQKRAHGNQCLTLSSSREWDRENIFKTIVDPNYAFSFDNRLGPCFVRKTPMYYESTVSVGEQGLGRADYNVLSMGDVSSACEATIPGRPKQKEKKCARFLETGNSKDLL